MKTSPLSDYPVRVRPASINEPDSVAGLYEGIYEMTLNSVVDIMFCPPVMELVPLPEDLDEITSALQARLATLLISRYSVTPESSLRSLEATIFYVSEREFEKFSGELHELSETLGDIHSTVGVTELLDYEVIR